MEHYWRNNTFYIIGTSVFTSAILEVDLLVVSMAECVSVPFPTVCIGCYNTYNQFCEQYIDNYDGVLTILRNHGLILSEKHCGKCTEIPPITGHRFHKFLQTAAWLYPSK